MLRIGFSTYIIASARNGTLYCGHTDDLILRATQHHEGLIKGFSKQYGCRHLVWFEIHDTRDEAFKRERQIKKWRRQWKLEMIEDLNPLWIDIRACPIWPLPDPLDFPDLYNRCLDFALG